MSTQIYRKDFEKIYKDTYNKVLRYVVIKCRNIDDINDIIQETYLELLKILGKKKILEIEDIGSYLLGISNNVLKRYYHKKKKDNIVYYYQDDSNLAKDIEDTFDLEADIITKHNVSKVWEYLKHYLYFAVGLKISEILSITDAEGNTYKVNSSGTTQEKYEYKLSIDVGINDLSKKLYINYNHNGTKYTEELIEK